MNCRTLFVVPYHLALKLRKGASKVQYACYGEQFAGRCFDCIVVFDQPVHPSSHDYMHEVLMTRLAPGGFLVHAYDGTKHVVPRYIKSC